MQILVIIISYTLSIMTCARSSAFGGSAGDSGSTSFSCKLYLVLGLRSKREISTSWFASESTIAILLTPTVPLIVPADIIDNKNETIIIDNKNGTIIIDNKNGTKRLHRQVFRQKQQ